MHWKNDFYATMLIKGDSWLVENAFLMFIKGRK